MLDSEAPLMNNVGALGLGVGISYRSPVPSKAWLLSQLVLLATGATLLFVVLHSLPCIPSLPPLSPHDELKPPKTKLTFPSLREVFLPGVVDRVTSK